VISARPALLRAAGVVAAASLIFLALMAVVGRLPVTDEVAFKAPGRQWAAGGGFRAPELEGLIHGVSLDVTQAYCIYQPMYSFAFGLWARLFGFSPRTCVVFDAFIHVLLVFATLALAWRAFSSTGRARPWLATVAALAVLPLGTAGRPDELAMIFGSGALFLLLPPNVRTRDVALAGAALGLCFACSSGAGICLGLIAFTLLVRTVREDLAQTVRRCLIAGVAALAGAAVVLGPFVAAHPGAIEQYVAHSRLAFHDNTVLDSWALARPHGTKYYTLLIGTLFAGLLAATLLGTRAAWRQWARYGVGTCLVLFFLAVALPLKNNYTWFLGPWLLIAAIELGYSLMTAPGMRGRALLPLAVLAAGHVSFAAYFAKDLLVLGTLPASQKPAAAAAQLRATIPAGAGVLTSKDLWWFIADRNRTYDALLAHPPPSAIDYVALAANGSGKPGVPASLPLHWGAAFTSRFVEVANNLPTRRTYLLGVPITNSSYGFGAMVYRVAR